MLKFVLGFMAIVGWTSIFVLIWLSLLGMLPTEAPSEEIAVVLLLVPMFGTLGLWLHEIFITGSKK